MGTWGTALTILLDRKTGQHRGYETIRHDGVHGDLTGAVVYDFVRIGTAMFQGNTIEVVWNGSKDRQPRRYRDWFRLDIPGRGAKLSGSYSKAGFVQQNIGAGTAFSASGWSAMTFDRSGRFTRAKGGSTSYGTDSGSVLARDRSETAGTYTIDGPLLVMKHRDGTVFRASLFFVGKDAKIIFVNGSQYRRR